MTRNNSTVAPVTSGLNYSNHLDKPKTKNSGRVCAYAGCDTKLSIYNLGKYCYRHAIEVEDRRLEEKYRGKYLR